MKKQWEEPRIMVQEFTANEYVAACGETEYGAYKFECDAGRAGVSYRVYDPAGNYVEISGWPYYTPCGQTHEADSMDQFLEGYSIRSRSSGENIPVIIWTENGTQVHCTTNLDRDSWETIRS